DRTPGRSRRPTRRPPLGLERLEDRAVPDASGVLVGTTLTITGTPQPFERVTLALDPASNQLVLSNFGVETQRFDSAAVTDIDITAVALNAQITVADNVLQPATITGGPGVNVLQGGGGPTNFNAGPSENRLVGGPVDGN